MEEMRALEKNKTWEVYTLPKGHKTVGCKCCPKSNTGQMELLTNTRPEGVHTSPSPGFEAQFDHRACKLQKSFHGHFDHSLFTKVSKGGKIAMLIVYVDDIVLSGDDTVEIIQLKKKMGDDFETKDLENLKYFLRMEFNCKLGNLGNKVLVDKEKYQHLVGILIYLSHTRSDISYVVNAVNKLMQAPFENHMEAEFWWSFVDRKSASGYCTFVWGNLVTWRSKKHEVVARSNAEVEYRAMSLRIYIATAADYILVVEKESVFQRLANDRFCSRNRCIVITGRGYPDVPTRRFLRLLVDVLALPAFCLVDCDPYGFDILTTYRFGSMQMAYDAKNLRIPQLQWIGAFASDSEKYDLPEQCLIPLTSKGAGSHLAPTRAHTQEKN
ncbi:meiotic recombination protein SPO11-1 isoform X4 [Cucumis melo var. makuwa]|uniref:Meiotic recombination protein SPO11-1 isoform X4 n=1 Tax=Cucumis melo var. makuwa TaxID=1194695 RepID=A0A5D3CC45_CUCMM|nr:meiotic recombination protein SPO11-1 isoform X4 [Cucumis melo var. makuwa]